MTCACCGSDLAFFLKTPHMRLERCPACGTYWAEHSVHVKADEPWQSVDVSPDFLSALKERRAIQSKKIISAYRNALQGRRILDYACGQGVFVETLAEKGYQIRGCDVSRAVTATISPLRFMALQEPWSVPSGWDFEVVALLDILEHSPEPDHFLNKLAECGMTKALIKVPLATGPIFWMARLLAQLGFPTLMEKLFLVGDVAPHTLYFTRQGLARLLEKAGFRQTASEKLAEVGRELPRRIRAKPKWWAMMSWPLALLGAAAECVSPVWPDTAVFLFERNAHA